MPLPVRTATSCAATATATTPATLLPSSPSLIDTGAHAVAATALARSRADGAGRTTRRPCAIPARRATARDASFAAPRRRPSPADSAPADPLFACHAARAVASVKRIVYSTCSIYTEENEAVVAYALQQSRRPFRLVEALPQWPHRGCTASPLAHQGTAAPHAQCRQSCRTLTRRCTSAALPTLLARRQYRRLLRRRPRAQRHGWDGEQTSQAMMRGPASGTRRWPCCRSYSNRPGARPIRDSRCTARRCFRL